MENFKEKLLASMKTVKSWKKAIIKIIFLMDNILCIMKMGNFKKFYNYIAGKLNGEYKLYYENGNFEEIGNMQIISQMGKF